jgi:hypothetical protein
MVVSMVVMFVVLKCSCKQCYPSVIQCVTLATGPGISLIILTPMKILQRNLNRGTFVV